MPYWNKTTVVGLFETTYDYSSYFNYEILEKIIYVHDLDRGPLIEYLLDFRRFCQEMLLIEVCGDVTLTSMRYRVEFKLNCERDKLEFQCDHSRVSIKHRIANCLNMKNHPRVALYLRTIKEGCVSLEFLVPDFVVKSLFLSFEDRQIIALYKEMRVKSITIHYPDHVQVNQVYMIVWKSYCSLKTVHSLDCGGRGKSKTVVGH